MICYGSLIWGHRAPFWIDKLRRINRMAMNTFGCFPRSTPTTALEVMFDIVPLHLHCLREGVAARLRLDNMIDMGWDGTNENKTHSTSHLRFWENVLIECNLSPNNTDVCSVIKWSNDFCVNRDSFDGKAKHRTLTQFNIFTDGSRISEQTGVGYIIYQNKAKINQDHFRLPDHATVFQAEVTAVKEAADALGRLPVNNLRYVKFFIDSQAAIKALANPIIKSKTVLRAVESLNALAIKANKISLVWIPAHRGFFGNTQVDDLAKKGAESCDPTKTLQIEKSPATFKAELLQFTYHKWAQEWRENPKAAATKHFYYSPNRPKARFVYKLARLELGRFVRIITGHNNLNYFQTRIGLWGDRRCRFCHERDETFLHLLLDCPRFLQARIDTFQDKLPCNDMLWSVRDIIDFSYLPSIDGALIGTWAHGDPANTDDLDSLASGLDSDPEQTQATDR